MPRPTRFVNALTRGCNSETGPFSYSYAKFPALDIVSISNYTLGSLSINFLKAFSDVNKSIWLTSSTVGKCEAPLKDPLKPPPPDVAIG